MDDRVVAIEDLRIARRQRLPGEKECAHRRIVLDDNGEIVKCSDCGVQVSPFWALKMLTSVWSDAQRKLKASREQLQADRETILHLTAARKAEEAWRSRTMVPVCPHCSRGILTTDGFGASLMTKKLELAWREKEKEQHAK